MRTADSCYIVRSDNGRASMTLEEIGKELGMSTGAVYMTLHRALRKLRSHGMILEMKQLGDALDANRGGSPWTN